MQSHDRVYVLEANPRASRTVPLVSKVCNISMAGIATEIILSNVTGKNSLIKELKPKKIEHFGVKEAVFPFTMFHEVDPLLGPEMRSTGEVLGMANSFGLAFYKAQEGTQVSLPTSGTVLISVAQQDKPAMLEVAAMFSELNFKIKHKVPYITTLTAAMASVKGIKAYRETHLKDDKVKSLQEYHADITEE